LSRKKGRKTVVVVADEVTGKIIVVCFYDSQCISKYAQKLFIAQELSPQFYLKLKTAHEMFRGEINQQQ